MIVLAWLVLLYIVLRQCRTVSQLHIVLRQCRTVSQLHIVLRQCRIVSQLHIVLRQCRTVNQLYIVLRQCRTVSQPNTQLCFADLRLDLVMVWRNCECAIRPEVTLCG